MKEFYQQVPEYHWSHWRTAAGNLFFLSAALVGAAAILGTFVPKTTTR